MESRNFFAGFSELVFMEITTNSNDATVFNFDGTGIYLSYETANGPVNLLPFQIGQVAFGAPDTYGPYDGLSSTINDDCSISFELSTNPDNLVYVLQDCPGDVSRDLRFAEFNAVCTTVLLALEAVPPQQPTISTSIVPESGTTNTGTEQISRPSSSNRITTSLSQTVTAPAESSTTNILASTSELEITTPATLTSTVVESPSKSASLTEPSMIETPSQNPTTTTSIAQEPSTTQPIMVETTSTPVEPSSTKPSTTESMSTALLTSALKSFVTSVTIPSNIQASTPVPPASTTSTTASTASCTGPPALFNVAIYQSGAGNVQYLTSISVHGGSIESEYGYDVLRTTPDISSAAVLSIHDTIQGGDSLVIHGAPDSYAAVRVGVIGNSIVQFFTGDHVTSGMLVYKATVDASCEISLNLIHAPGYNITAQCAGLLGVFGERFLLQRGATCSEVALFAVPYVVPITPWIESTSTSAVVPTPTQSPSPSCEIPPYFIILVNETGFETQYLYDPFSTDDEALSFTPNPDLSLIFSISSNDSLTFQVWDVYGNLVQLVSEQDPQNPGNEAVYFTTAARFKQRLYLPVTADLNPDCTLSLRLPADAASIVQVCDSTLFLTLAPAKNCVPASLTIQPYTP